MTPTKGPTRMTAGPARPAELFGAGIHPMADDEVERIARRVVELLTEGDPAPAPPAGELVDTATLARLLGVSRDTVRRYADELGALAVGGTRGRGRPLRFDPEFALAAWGNGRSTSERSQPALNRSGKRKRRRSRATLTGSGAELLPVKGREDGP